MIIASTAGGLGNQMFQYAMARRLAVRHGVELLLDASTYQKARHVPGERRLRLFNFKIHAREASLVDIAALRDRYGRKNPVHRAIRLVRRVWPEFLWRRSHIREKQYRFQPEALSFPDNVYLAGFWQSEKYFADIAPVIHEEFELADNSISESARETVNQVRRKHGTVVSLHVRRGDLVYAFEVLQARERVHGPPMGIEYFQRAMSQFDPQACFFVFSDSPKDIEWCRQNLRSPCLEFSTGESELWDFVAMSACDHHIISNSSFSWWAAWLNTKANRRVIAPSRWSGPDAKRQMDTDDLIPKDWTMI